MSNGSNFINLDAKTDDNNQSFAGYMSDKYNGDLINLDVKGSDIINLDDDANLVNIKPKNAKDVIRSIYKIQDGVNWESDIEFKQNVISKYFDTDGFESGRERIIDPRSAPVTYGGEYTTIQGINTSYANTEEDDLVKFFKSPKKHELYKKWLETGDLRIDDIPEELKEGFNSIFYDEKNERINFLTEDYVTKYAENYKGEVTSIIQAEGKLISDGSEPYITKYEEIVKGDYKTGIFEAKRRAEETSKAYELQVKYLEGLHSVIEEDGENYKSLLKSVGVTNSAELTKLFQDPNIDINAKNDILNQAKALQVKLDDYSRKAEKIQDDNSILRVMGLNFSFGYNVSLQAEKAYMEMAGLVKAGLSTISGKIDEDWQLTKYLLQS